MVLAVLGLVVVVLTLLVFLYLTRFKHVSIRASVLKVVTFEVELSDPEPRREMSPPGG